jgi:hypothetical protein
MQIEIILTCLGTVVAIVGSNIALIGWLRSDMKAFEQIAGKKRYKRNLKIFMAVYALSKKGIRNNNSIGKL